MVMSLGQPSQPTSVRRTGEGLVMAGDRTREFKSAARRTRVVRFLRIACPATIVALLGMYAVTIAQKAGVVSTEMAGAAIRKILPEDLSMKNPRYEGFGEDGTSYMFAADTARQDLTSMGIITLNGIRGEVYQADKTRTDITAVRGEFDHAKSILELYEEINVVSQSGLKARLTRGTLVTKESLLTSPEPVVVEFPNGSIRSKQMALRQKAREATFSDEVIVELTQPPPDPAKEAAPEPAATAQESALFTPQNGPLNINADRLDVSDANKIAIFAGSVQASQGDATLTTPELEVTYEGGGMLGGDAPKPKQSEASNAAGNVRRIVAKKPVVMKRANGDVVTGDLAEFDAKTETAVLTGEVIMTSGTDRSAKSDRVEIDEADQTILLSGQVVVTQGGNELRGGRLAINRQQGTAVLTAPPNVAGPGRITARLERPGNPSAPGAKDSDTQSQGAALASFKTNPNAPVDIVADSLDVNDQKKLALFRGEVEATQDTFRIRCAELFAFYKGEAGLMQAANPGAETNDDKSRTELTKIEARKDVRVTSKNGQTATGDWADYDAKSNKVTMGGNVVLSQGKNMVRGTRLLIDLTTGESKIDTSRETASGKPKADGSWVAKSETEPADVQGRASAVFFPQDMKKEQEGSSARPAKSPESSPAVDAWSATNSGPSGN